MVQAKCRTSKLRSLEWAVRTFVWAYWKHTPDKKERQGKMELVEESEEMVMMELDRRGYIAQDLVI